MRSYHKVFATICLCFMYVGSVFAEEYTAPPLPEQKILGAEKAIPLGEIVVLNVSPVKNAPKNLRQVNYKWKILENGRVKQTGVQEWPDGSSVIFGAGMNPNKRFVAILSIGYLFVDEKEGKIEEVAQTSQLLLADIKLQGGNPDDDGEDNPQPPEPGPGPAPRPVPPPPPQPPPRPNFPEGKYGLAPKAYDWAMRVNLPPDQKAKSAQALSAAFSSVAAQTAAGTLRDIRSILQETKRANLQALSGVQVPAAAWEPWSADFQKVAFDLYKSGRLKAPSDFAEAWREIATGLEGVR